MFNRIRVDELLFYRFYNYQIELVEENVKAKLSRNRIYFLFIYKLKQIKKYLNENLKKDFIVSNQASFVYFIFFIEK